MPLSNPLDILLAHDRWATRNILETCAPLAPEQFHRRFELGPGSLHDTATHIVSAMRAWGDVLARRPLRPRPDMDGAQRTPAELQKLLDEAADELARLAAAHPLDELVVREHDGIHYSFTRGGVLTHVTTHGMHHRAQCLNMLRHLGISPLPASSVADWMRIVDPAG